MCKTVGCRWPWILCIIRKGNPQNIRDYKIMLLQLIACIIGWIQHTSVHRTTSYPAKSISGAVVYLCCLWARKGNIYREAAWSPLQPYQLLSAASRENQATAWECAGWECDENSDWVDRTHVILVFYVCSLNGFRIVMHLICLNICSLHKSIRATCEKEN